MFRTVDFTYDITNNQIVGGTAALLQPSDTPYFVYPETVLVRMYVYKVVSSVYTAYTDFSADDLYSATLNTDYDSATQNLAKTNDNLFNSTDDWALANPAAGRICFRLSLDTEEMYTALGTAAALTDPQLELCVRKQDGSYIATIIRIPVSVMNGMMKNTLVALSAGTDFVTTAASTSTITMLTDQTANIKVGAQVRIGYSNAYHFFTVNTITSGLLTISEAKLPLTAAALQSVAYQVIPAGNYYTASSLSAALSGKQPRDLDAVLNDLAMFNATGSTVDGGIPMPDWSSTYYRVFRTGTLNFKKTPSYSNIYTVPSGNVFCIDTIEPVIHDVSGYVDAPSVAIGNTVNPTAYLAATPFTKTVAGERQVITVNSSAIPTGTQIRTTIQAATASTELLGYMLVKGYLIPAINFSSSSSSSSRSSASSSSSSSKSSSSSSRSSASSSSSSSSSISSSSSSSSVSSASSSSSSSSRSSVSSSSSSSSRSSVSSSSSSSSVSSVSSNSSSSSVSSASSSSSSSSRSSVSSSSSSSSVSSVSSSSSSVSSVSSSSSSVSSVSSSSSSSSVSSVSSSSSSSSRSSASSSSSNSSSSSRSSISSSSSSVSSVSSSSPSSSRSSSSSSVSSSSSSVSSSRSSSSSSSSRSSVSSSSSSVS